MTFDTGFSKSVFASTTFWAAFIGAIAMLIPTIAGKVGVTSTNVPIIAQYIVQGLSFIGVVYGRFTAKQTVTLTGGPTPPASVVPGSKG
jgi:uncharacterized membrane protein